MHQISRAGALPVAIKLAGNGQVNHGLMFAPHGMIELSGSNHDLTSSTGVAWGERVKINGSAMDATGYGGPANGPP